MRVVGGTLLAVLFLAVAYFNIEANGSEAPDVTAIFGVMAICSFFIGFADVD